MRLFITASVSVLSLAVGYSVSGCGDDDCTVTLTCPRPNDGGAGGAGGAPGGNSNVGGEGVGGAPATLSLSTVETVRVVRDDTAELQLSLTRDGVDGPIGLVFAGLPAGVTAMPTQVAAGEVNVTVTLSADTGALLGPATFSIVDDDGVAAAVDVSLLVADPPGTLDETFGVGGIVELVSLPDLDGSSAPRSIMEASNGDIIVAGDSPGFVVRVDPDGNLVTAFNDNARAAIPANAVFEGGAYDLTGTKVVACGRDQNTGDGVAVRFNDDGTIDSGFSVSGVATLAGTQFSKCTMQSDSKVVIAAGDSIVRYDATGALDNTFAGDGRYEDTVVTGELLFNALIDPGGSIIATGRSSSTTWYSFRLSSSGVRDLTYGNTNGAAFIAANGEVAPTDAALLGGGPIVAGYNNPSGNSGEFALFASNGGAVWSDGSKAFNIGTTDRIYGAAVQTDGKLVLSGRYYNSAGMTSGVYVLRIDGQGDADPGFGVAGVANFPTVGSVSPHDVAVMSDGKIVMVMYDPNRGPTIMRMWD